MSEQLPKPIEPQDIRVGMRVRNEQNLSRDETATWEFTVESIADVDRKFVSTSGRHYYFGVSSGTWTLLADAPTPDREVGSHWRDPETGAEYVKTDIEDRGSHYLAYTQCRSLGANSTLIPEWSEIDDAIIARLVPIPAFDPATLWPPAGSSDPRCGEYCGGNPWHCSRPYDHDGLHAAYASDAEGVQPVYLWGDPR